MWAHAPVTHLDVSTTGASSPAVAFATIPAMVAAAAAASTALNLLVWFVGTRLDDMVIGWREVALFSVIGAVAGGAVYAALGRWAARPQRSFFILTVLVLVVYALGPLSAAYAPYMEGATTFNTTTVVATEIMHLVSGFCVYFALTRGAAVVR